MGITSTEIREVGFEHSLRGYDVGQVDVFLEKMAVGVEEMAAQIDELVLQVAQAEHKAEEAEAARKVAEENAANAAKEAKAAAAVLEPVAPSATAAPAIDTEELERANARVRDAESSLAETRARLRESERQVRTFEVKIEDLEKELAEKEERDKIISEAFISAQRSADNLKEEARAEGERIYRESEAKARELIKEALSKKQQIFTEIDTLEASCAKFRKDYKKMIERFAAEADGAFSEIRPPVIPDSIINELMPNPEIFTQSIDATAAIPPVAERDTIPEEKIPMFETQVIPSLPIEEEDLTGQTFTDDGLDVEEV